MNNDIEGGLGEQYKKALFLIIGILMVRLCSPSTLSAVEGVILLSFAQADLFPDLYSEALAKEEAEGESLPAGQAGTLRYYVDVFPEDLEEAAEMLAQR